MLKRILKRTLEGFVGMFAVAILIHILCLVLWLIISFLIWENPIDTLTRGYTNLWEPAINEGWTVKNRLALVIFYCSGLFLSGSLYTLNFI